MQAVADPVDGFLASYDPEVQELARGLRALVQRVVPDAEEKLLRPWKTIAYGRARKFCAISPHKSWVNLQFHGGSGLPDPDGLLSGTGKSMRHVKVASSRDVRRKALAALIRAAAKEAS
ncbi:MAG: DUF1801 domain-containing protein [Myxococcota bacterium]